MARKFGMTSQIIMGIFVGVTLGLSLKSSTRQPWSHRDLMYLQFPGELFLRTVNCLILPLVVSSVISSSCSIAQSGKIGILTLYYYLATTTLGICLSVVLTHFVRPDKWALLFGNDENNRDDLDQLERAKSRVNFLTIDILLDLVRNLLPDNLIQACLSQYQTVLITKPKWNKTGEQVEESSAYDLEISHRYTSGSNVLGLVMAGLIFGLSLGSMPTERQKPLKDFFQSVADVTTEIMEFVVRSAPVAVIFLVAGKLLKSDNSEFEFAQLIAFVLTVFVGLAVQALLVLPMLHFIITAKSPYNIMKNVTPALATAFATSSSTATVPTTIKCLDKLGVAPQVSRFVAPIGATINMDGIALYETIGAIFIMRMQGIHLPLMQNIAVSITCTLSCIGAAGIPSGGYTMLIMVLHSLGVPIDDVTLIIAVDTFVDRFRTMVNIVADSLGADIIDKSLREGRWYVKNENRDCNTDFKAQESQ